MMFKEQDQEQDLLLDQDHQEQQMIGALSTGVLVQRQEQAGNFLALNSNLSQKVTGPLIP